MIKDGKVRLEGCICEPCSDISTNCRDMRSKFGYITLSEMAGIRKYKKVKCNE